MPSPVVHLWIAKEVAKLISPLLRNSDFYLGNIAPDAVLARGGDNEPAKNATHLVVAPEIWEQNTLHEFLKLTKQTSFEIGYYMHILTDIQFRKKSRAFNTANNIPYELWEELNELNKPYVLQNVFDSEAEYLELVEMANGFSISKFPNGITLQDIRGEINYAKTIVASCKMNSGQIKSKFPIPDEKKFAAETVLYLEEVMGLSQLRADSCDS